MFFGLLSARAVLRFGESLAFNSKRSIKYVSANNHPCQANQKLVDISLLIHLRLGLTNVVEVVTLLMIYILEFVF